jgi:hypothetical protein
MENHPTARTEGSDSHPAPPTDWIDQQHLARLLGISAKTASVRSKQGDLRIYEHGVRGCGRRKYSIAIIERELGQRWSGV